MNPAVQARIHDIIRASGIKPERALEVGGTTGARSLLRTNALAGCERYCLNPCGWRATRTSPQFAATPTTCACLLYTSDAADE